MITVTKCDLSPKKCVLTALRLGFGKGRCKISSVKTDTKKSLACARVRACAITRYYNIIYKNKILLLYIYFNAREENFENQLIICKNFI